MKKGRKGRKKKTVNWWNIFIISGDNFPIATRMVIKRCAATARRSFNTSTITK